MSGTGIVRFLPKALPRYLAPRHAARASARFRDLGRMVALATVLVAAPVLAPSPAQAVTVAVYEGNVLQFYAVDGQSNSGTTGPGRRVDDDDRDGDGNVAPTVNDMVDADGQTFHSRTGSPNQNNVTVQDLNVDVDPTNNKMTVSGQLRIDAGTTDNPITIYAYVSNQEHDLETPEILFSTKTSGCRTGQTSACQSDWDNDATATRIATWVTLGNQQAPVDSNALSNPYSHYVASGLQGSSIKALCLLSASGNRDCNRDSVGRVSTLADGGIPAEWNYSAHALIQFNSGLEGNIDFRLVFDYGVIPLPPALWAMGAALGLFGFAGVARRRRANNASKEPCAA